SSCYLPALLVALLVQLSSQTQYLGSSEDICRLFANGTKLRKPGGCNEWIVCRNSLSVYGGACGGETPHFNLKSGPCSKTLDSTYCEPPCSSTTKGYVGDTLDCANWYYCEGQTVRTSGRCDAGLSFDHQQQKCLAAGNTCGARFEMCDVVPTGVPFRDEKSCNKFFTCKKYKLVSNTCETGKYYDTASGQCLALKHVTCEHHPVPENVCGTQEEPLRNKLVSDGATCRGYYYCHDVGAVGPDPRPTRQFCGVDYFFSQEHQECVPRDSQKCPWDRCDGRTEGYEIAEVEGCQNYYRCFDNKESELLSCGEGYFDTVTQNCTSIRTAYRACIN
ncbi:hypothetical protein KR054_010916, partial [Drosophila jambulina]